MLAAIGEDLLDSPVQSQGSDKEEEAPKVVSDKPQNNDETPSH